MRVAVRFHPGFQIEMAKSNQNFQLSVAPIRSFGSELETTSKSCKDSVDLARSIERHDMSCKVVYSNVQKSVSERQSTRIIRIRKIQ